MNAHPSEWEETPRLLPRVERDLPADRHQLHKERLMTRIHEDLAASPDPHATVATRPAARRNPFLRRMVLVPLTAGVLAGALATGLFVFGGAEDTGTGGGPGTSAAGPAMTTRLGTADPEGAARLLNAVSLAAAEAPAAPVRDGQYIYIESKSAGIVVRHVHGTTSLAGTPLHRRQSWESRDGRDGWLIEPGTTGPEGRTLAGTDEHGNEPEPTLNAPSYDYLTTLPTDPDVLLAKIYKETKGMGNDPDHQAFTTIGDLLIESCPPAELTTALYKAAAEIPGVVAVDDAVDATGRHGVAVARLEEATGERTEWIFDRKTHVFLGERTVQAERDPDGVVPPGTVVFTNAVLTRATVDGVRQLPGDAG
ncbi:CU044_5270 family protein [Actinacidiphila glaucinigra]|uniref:CU044_5270 family protein n=1 Tax=Actinacidiphila glaucinigra TaxID=235986 RepID=UPI002DD7D698|nr:CU044_5270 family protein [Actinacidiphila glaucinigra]WSD61287.1 CU044_5270 family protein [Actinacidiphila glaucinigra]